MDLSTVITIIGGGLSLISTIAIGVMSYMIKRTISGYDAADKANAEDIRKVREELSDLKSDLPMVYTLREDYIRSTHNVETRIKDLDSKIDNVMRDISAQLNSILGQLTKRGG